MSFIDHIEALRWHIIRSALVVLALAILVFIKIEWIFDRIILGPAHSDFISYRWFCWLAHKTGAMSLCLGDVKLKFQNTEVAGQFMMSLSASMMIGFILSIPYILWELWRFIKPALKEKEIKAAKGIVFWCSLLFFTGVLFSYFILVPYTVNFFGNYQLSPLFQNIITIDNYYGTLSDLLLALGVVFELPILVFFLSRIGLLTPALMRSYRRYAFVILFILAELITPPDLFSAFLVFIPLYLLYEVSVFVSLRSYNRRKRREAEKELE